MTQTLPLVSNLERRVHIRRETMCRATVYRHAGEPVVADIREYSEAGLYLEFIDAPDALVRAELAFASVTLKLTPTHTSPAPSPAISASFAARVAHLSELGMGLSVDDMPEAVVAALRAAGERVGHREHIGADAILSTQQAKALQAECSTLYRGFVDAVARDFLHKAPPRLREQSEIYTSLSDRSALELAASELVRQTSSLVPHIYSAVQSRIRVEGRDHDENATVGRRAQLALMGDSELDDFLLLTGVITRLDERFSLQLHELDRRYGRLVHTAIERKNNPYAPEVVCRGVQTALQSFDFGRAVWTVLYGVMEQSVTEHSHEFYRQLNSTLAALRTPAAASVSAERTPTRSYVKKVKSPQDVADMADTLNRLYLQNQITLTPNLSRAAAGLAGGDNGVATNAGTGGAGGTTGGAGVGGIGNLSTSLGGTGATSAAAPNPVEIESAPATPNALLNLVQQLKGSSQHLNRSRGVGAGVGVGGAGAGLGGGEDGAASAIDMSLPEASLEELLAAIDGLPQTLRASQTIASITSLAHLLNENLAAFDEGRARRVPAGYREILDACSTLFAKAQTELLPTSVSGSLIKRLERTLLKLSLKDAQFPTSPEHPARRVVNLIDQYAMVADDAGKFFDRKLESNLVTLVDRICKRADTDPQIFQVVGDSLDQDLVTIRDARRDRVERLQEAFEARDRIRVARTRVDRALERRLSGSQAPRLLLRLLDAGWRHYLTLLAVREGPDGVDWAASLAIVDRLLGVGVAKDADVRRQADIVLLSDVERKLATVVVNMQHGASLMDELAALLASDLTSSADRWDRVAVPNFKSASSTVANDAVTVTATTAAPSPARPRVGEWWDFVTGASTTPMQLVWISAELPNCAFANRSATNKLELTLDELAQRHSLGTAKPTVDFDEPVLDRTEYSLFDEAYERLVHQATHDPVTQLLNRKGFMLRLAHIVSASQGTVAHTLCIIEFDEFRMIANTCGVGAVEALAIGLAGKLREQLKGDAVLGMLREDTMALLLQQTHGLTALARIEAIMAEIKDYHFRHAEHGYSIGVSVGVSDYLPTQMNAMEAVRRADAACSAAKSLGRNRVQTYELTSPELQTQQTLMAWAGRVDSFLGGTDLYLRAQRMEPINAASGKRPFVEILLGVDGHMDRESSVTDFIAAVERTGRAPELDMWVIKRAFETIRQNAAYFQGIDGVSINLSARSLSSREVKDFLHAHLPQSGIAVDKIIFEITETAAIASYAAAQDFIREIRRYGCRFSLDDFGTGFTSYAHLKNLHTDVLKIDGTFVTEMLENPSDLAMVKSMNDLAHALGMTTVAEWVASPALLVKLAEIGVDYAQGYAVHTPCRLDELVREPVSGNATSGLRLT